MPEKVPKLDNPRMDVFGLLARENELGIIGSKKSRTEDFDKDVEVLQSDPNYKLGYTAITQKFKKGDLIASEEFFSLMYVITYGLASNQQEGIHPWKNNFSYAKGAMVKKDGRLYSSKESVNHVDFDGEAEFDTSSEGNWEEILQIRELRESIEAVKTDVADRLDAYTTSSLSVLQELHRLTEESMPIGMVYEQDKGEKKPGDLFGGSWQAIIIPTVLGSPKMRYETREVPFPGNAYQSLPFVPVYTAGTYDENLYGSLQGTSLYITHPAGSPRIDEVQAIPKDLFNNPGQTVRKWRKTAHEPRKE